MAPIGIDPAASSTSSQNLGPGSGATQPTPTQRLNFDRYILDLDRGCLLSNGEEIALRPKTFAVLHHLLERRGSLVSKDDLFAAVWPNLAVTDDAIVQSIGELRRALGHDGARLIRTIPRRGYRLEAETPKGGALPARVADGAVTPDAASSGPDRAHRHRLNFILAGLVLATITVAVAAGVVSGLRVDPAGNNPPRLAVATRPVVAVLPLANQSKASSSEYFADGLTGDIINALGRFSALTVMSWNAVAPYKGRTSGAGDLQRALRANYLVEGSVLREGDSVRVSAQLVDEEGHVLWAARFDEALSDVFALQDKISTEVVRSLAIRLTQIEQRRVLSKPTQNFEAYDYVLRARVLLQQPTRAGIAEARTLLRRATELDPNYGAAYAALAETYYTSTSMGWAESPIEYLNRAEELARDALSLDTSEVRARVILARIDIFHQRYREAEAEINLAMAANPNDARALAGRGNILMWLGRTDQAIDALEQAERIDPNLGAIDRFALSLAYYVKEEYQRAIAQAELNVRATAEAGFNRVVQAAAYAKLGRQSDAERVAAIIRLDPTFDVNEFGSKFLNASDLTRLRDGLRAAGL